MKVYVSSWRGGTPLGPSDGDGDDEFAEECSVTIERGRRKVIIDPEVFDVLWKLQTPKKKS